jgi:hypothetical protein
MTQPFRVPHTLTRAFVLSRASDTVFLVGGTVNKIRTSGESAEFDGCPNVFFVPIKIKCCMDTAAFFDDDQMHRDLFQWQLEQAAHELEQFVRERNAKHVVPDPNIAKSNWAGPMHLRSPKCRRMLDEWLALVVTPYEIDYTFKVTPQ